MRALVAVNVYNDDAKSMSFVVRSYFDSLGIESDCVSSVDIHIGVTLASLFPTVNPSEYGLAIVLGGDGTILRVARLLEGYPIPIVGIHFGSFGFLANSSEPGVLHIIEEALAGNLVVERRTNIHLEIYCSNNEDSIDDVPDEPRERLFALNELALNRGSYGGLIDFELMIAGVPIAMLRADGIVVSTATGSTGYALSAGGPLVAPGHRGLLTIPIAPHTLRSRAIVAAPGDVVEIAVKPTRDGKCPVLSVDGEAFDLDTPIRKVVARAGDVPTSLMYYERDVFYHHVSKYIF